MSKSLIQTQNVGCKTQISDSLPFSLILPSPGCPSLSSIYLVQKCLADYVNTTAKRVCHKIAPFEGFFLPLAYRFLHATIDVLIVRNPTSFNLQLIIISTLKGLLRYGAITATRLGLIPKGRVTQILG